MKYFLGVVPSEPIYHTIAKIQSRFGDNRLEPHITLRPPVQVSNEPGWLHAIEEVCCSFSPFSIFLPGTGRFGNRVLFIDVISQPLTVLHGDIMAAIHAFEPPDIHREQSRPFQAALTLGRTWCGYTQQDFDAMEKLAKEVLSTEPVVFDVDFLRIYHKPSHQGRYEKLKDVPVTG